MSITILPNIFHQNQFSICLLIALIFELHTVYLVYFRVCFFLLFLFSLPTLVGVGGRTRYLNIPHVLQRHTTNQPPQQYLSLPHMVSAIVVDQVGKCCRVQRSESTSCGVSKPVSVSTSISTHPVSVSG